MGRLRRRLARILEGRAPLCHAPDWTTQVVERFVYGPAGDHYGVSPAGKARLVEQFHRNTRAIESGTGAVVHVVLAEALLSIPPETEGGVVECGVWKGASSASLSLVCDLVGRKLWVCDSFAGLPDEGMQRHTGMHTGVYGYYRPGMFTGSLDEVKRHIAQYGAPGVCQYVTGFFEESLAAVPGPLAMAFLDVDLAGSTRDCLRQLWPKLAEGATVYCDDAGDLDVVKVYFDEPWWRDTLGCAAPGLVGSGCGLPLSPAYSSIGYTRKITRFDPAQWRRMPFLHYPEDEA
jgi:O-methyltransferase